MTDAAIDIFQEIHSELPREGPGNDASTRRAFSMLNGLAKRPKILDIGCGPGLQTLQLAKLTDGYITALDVQQKYLDTLSEHLHAEKVSANVATVQGSMFELPFEPKSFDLIWSEGAIFIIGFEKGLMEWKKYLKPKGLMAVTHISWLRPKIAEEPKKFWEMAYPAITSIEHNLSIIEKSGDKTMGHFVLPESAWWDDYYIPLEKRIEFLKKTHKANQSVLNVLNEEEREIELYRKYSGDYGYVFYVMQEASAPS